ncbi:hypothetical protein D9619_003572 [Psilocybe cf. subviscida]|uniref:DNA-directed RNA polymerase II subunit RPB9-like zinc ribbon domain-containing protein n=1 Tax=Psilocybe cf. subviscida TaxID=2480587 RepID=A0A8H5AXT2_9AGAR|nr:hypothetical protein D9619_003572 [Psilocybe cf. subviscida]
MSSSRAHKVGQHPLFPPSGLRPGTYHSNKGSLLFCPDCGTLLSLPRDGEKVVVCEQCAYEEPATSYENVIITTRSDPEAFPSVLRQKRKTQTKQHETGDQGTLVTEKCPACGHMQAYSKEMQVRNPRVPTVFDLTSCILPAAKRRRGFDDILHVCFVQGEMARKQLGYTYTPTAQNVATIPKPPNALATMATRGSLNAKRSFGRLGRG